LVQTLPRSARRRRQRLRPRESRSPNASSPAPSPAEHERVSSTCFRTYSCQTASLTPVAGCETAPPGNWRRWGDSFASCREKTARYDGRFCPDPPAVSFVCTFIPTWRPSASTRSRRDARRSTLERAMDLGSVRLMPVGRRSASGKYTVGFM
jgi:hypothetical protein